MVISGKASYYDIQLAATNAGIRKGELTLLMAVENCGKTMGQTHETSTSSQGENLRCPRSRDTSEVNHVSVQSI